MDKKISELDPVIQLATTDVLPIVNLGTTRKVTIEQIIDLVPEIPTKTSDLINDGSDGISSYVSQDSIDGLATVVYVDQKDLLKVDKVVGERLINASEITKLANQSGINTGDQDISGLALKSYVDSQDLLKVDKITGKGLSTNDYTTIERNKLAGIDSGAEVNVNADWIATAGDAQILNKPIIPNAQIQSDWSQIDTLAFDFIKNKPTIPVTTNFVPYSGAVSDVNLGEFGVQLGNIEFDLTPTNTPTTEGSLVWNDLSGTLDLKLKGGAVTLQIGQETVARIVNKTSTNITLLEANYQAVRVTGAQGQRPKVDLAQANNDLNSTTTLGLVTETILNNEEGFITTSGQVQQINTTGSLQGETWLDGDVLYLSGTVAGRITNIKPIAPIHTVIIGFVEYAHEINGKIFVKVDNGYELEELHNVSAIAPNNNEILTYELGSTLWKPKTVISALGFTPYNSSNPNNYTSNLGTVTNVSALTLGTSGTDISSTVVNGTTTPAITLNIPTSSALNRGVLSSTDWNTFNNKQNAITNPITGSGTTNYIPKFTGSTAIGNSLIYDNGTNVGIGTTSPSEKLHVSGNVRVTGSFKDSNDSSGTSGQVLSSTGTGTSWVTNGGSSSGLKGIHSLIELSTGQSTTVATGGFSLSGAGEVTNRVLVTPYIPANNVTTQSLSLNVSIGVTTALIKIVIFSNSGGKPGTKLYESANLDCSTTGIKTANVVFNFIAGTTYWLGTHSSSTQSISVIRTSVIPICVVGSTSYFSYSGTVDFGTLGSEIIPAPILSTTTAQTPLIYLNV